MRPVLFAFALMVITSGDAIATPRPLFSDRHIPLHIAQISRAEERCVSAVRSAGYRVNGILSTSTFSGGAEIIMEVRDRRESFVVGCDYAENTGDIELYQLENSGYRSNSRYDERYNDQYDDRYNDRYGDQHDDEYNDPYNDPYNNPYGRSSDDWSHDRHQGGYNAPYPGNDNWQGGSHRSTGVRDEGYAEQIARAVVGDQLGIDDPYSDIVRVDLVRRESRDRNWIVEGRVNGAPFVVRIRSSDAYILGFDLY
jgi:hypothetical protein